MALLGSKIKQLDPENEVLRNEVCLVGDGPPNLDDTIPALVEKTSKIHAGFLFDAEGKEALKQLCLRLCGTSESLHYDGWKGFAIDLGLDGLQVEYINNQHTNDPAYTALAVFVQEGDSTLDKIILTLRKIKRLDIIVKTGDLIENLANAVIRRQATRDENDSGYFASIEDIETQRINQQSVIMPQFLPSVPHALQKFRYSEEIVSNVFATTVTVGFENEGFQTNSNVPEPPVKLEKYKAAIPSQEKKNYSKTVMLTFASDGWQMAQEIAATFRRETKNNDRIGVLILNDHAAKVNANPEDFINACVYQVNFIVPIITKLYLEAVSASNSAHEENSMLGLDHKYVKYIYTLMNTQYVHDNCENRKVRCIIPDDLLHLTYKHPLLYTTPIFKSWVKYSAAEQLKELVLKAKI